MWWAVGVSGYGFRHDRFRKLSHRYTRILQRLVYAAACRGPGVGHKSIPRQALRCVAGAGRRGRFRVLDPQCRALAGPASRDRGDRALRGSVHRDRLSARTGTRGHRYRNRGCANPGAVGDVRAARRRLALRSDRRNQPDTTGLALRKFCAPGGNAGKICRRGHDLLRPNLYQDHSQHEPCGARTWVCLARSCRRRKKGADRRAGGDRNFPRYAADHLQPTRVSGRGRVPGALH